MLMMYAERLAMLHLQGQISKMCQTKKDSYNMCFKQIQTSNACCTILKRNPNKDTYRSGIYMNLFSISLLGAEG